MISEFLLASLDLGRWALDLGLWNSDFGLTFSGQ